MKLKAVASTGIVNRVRKSIKCLEKKLTTRTKYNIVIIISKKVNTL